jgi:hypothetical protein
MKMDPEQNDASLDKCLQSWRVTASLPPRFQEQVWHRIEQAETGREIPLLAALQNLAGLFLTHRAWVASYLTLALVVGLALGFHQAREETSSLSANLGQRYVQSLDPYLKMRH